MVSFVLRIFAETLAAIARERMASLTMQKKHIVRVALVTAGILLVPLVAMQVTDEVAWDRTDFLVAGAILFGAGMAFELVARRSGSVAYRVAVGLAVGAGLFLVWMNLAVGLIGSEDNPANLLYLGVLLVGFVGAAVARFRPRGMARALFATALAQFLVPVIAFLVFRPDVSAAEATAGMVGVVTVNALFVMLFAASGLLFRRVDEAEKARSRTA
jgi:hypothetical protein